MEAWLKLLWLKCIHQHGGPFVLGKTKRCLNGFLGWQMVPLRTLDHLTVFVEHVLDILCFFNHETSMVRNICWLLGHCAGNHGFTWIYCIQMFLWTWKFYQLVMFEQIHKNCLFKNWKLGLKRSSNNVETTNGPMCLIYGLVECLTHYYYIMYDDVLHLTIVCWRHDFLRRSKRLNRNNCFTTQLPAHLQATKKKNYYIQVGDQVPVPNTSWSTRLSYGHWNSMK